MNRFIINALCAVSFSGAEAGEDDSAGGRFGQRKDFLCEPPEEAVRTSRGTDPAGWRATAPVQTQILPSKGALKEKEA